MSTINDIYSLMDRNKKLIAVALFEDKNLEEFYHGLLVFFSGVIDKGYELIFVNYNASGDAFLRNNGFNNIFEINACDIEKLDFVDLFIAFDWNTVSFRFPEKAKVVQLVHCLSINSNPCDYMSSYGLRADYTFLIRAKISELERIRLKLCKTASTGFPFAMLREKGCLIPGGYPEIDSLINKLNRHRSSSGQAGKKILFATTGVVIDRLLVDHGIVIIRKLLEAFPEYEVVFRPTPSDRNLPIVSAMRAEFSANTMFSVDVGGLFEVINDSCLIIADSTALKEVFALAKSVPYVFCNFAANNNNVTRSDLGYEVSNIRDLIISVRKVLSGEQITADCIEKYLSNPGRSAQYLLDNIEFILEDKINPEWFYYQNINACKPIEKPGDYYRYIANYIQSTCVKSWSLLIIDHALAQFPESAYLLGIKSKILFYLGQFDEAREVFVKANAIDSHETALTIDTNCTTISNAGFREMIKRLLPPELVKAIARLLVKFGL